MSNFEFTIEERGFRDLELTLKSFPGIMRSGQSKGSVGVGSALQKAVRRRIDQGKHATASPISNVSYRFKKVREPFSNRAFSKGQEPWKRRLRPERIPFHVLHKLVRFTVFRRGKGTSISFGAGIGETATSDRKIKEIAKFAIEGSKVTVTPKMRRLFALQKKEAFAFGKVKPGIHFYPLRKDTTTIEMEGRDLLDTPFRQNRQNLGKFFERKFYPRVRKLFRKKRA